MLFLRTIRLSERPFVFRGELCAVSSAGRHFSGQLGCATNYPTDSANMINGILADNRGDPSNKFVVPGDTTHSMALKRIQGNGVPRMPPFATNELDPNAIQLLTDWINQFLPQRQSFADWQIQHFGSTSNPLGAPDVDADADGQTNYLEFLNYTNPNNSSSVQSSPALEYNGQSLELTFIQPANRSAVVETSLDLQNWAPWDIEGNGVMYPTQAMQRTLTISGAPAQQFFRLRLSSP